MRTFLDAPSRSSSGKPDVRRRRSACAAGLALALWLAPAIAKVDGEVDGPRIGDAPATFRTSVPNDTLWAIARSVAPPDVSPNQVMVALARRNSTAFAGGNMFVLRVGVPLVLPSLAEVRAENVAQAVATVETHRSAWRAGRPVTSPLTPSAAGPAPAPPVAPVPAPVPAAAPASTAAAVPAPAPSPAPVPEATPIAPVPAGTATTTAPATSSPTQPASSSPGTPAAEAIPAQPTASEAAAPRDASATQPGTSGTGTTKLFLAVTALLIAAVALLMLLRAKRQTAGDEDWPQTEAAPPPELPSARATGRQPARAAAPTSAPATAPTRRAATAGATAAAAPRTPARSPAPTQPPRAAAVAAPSAGPLVLPQGEADQAEPAATSVSDPALELLVAKTYLELHRPQAAHEWLLGVSAHGPEPLRQEAARLLGGTSPTGA